MTNLPLPMSCGRKLLPASLPAERFLALFITPPFAPPFAPLAALLFALFCAPPAHAFGFAEVARLAQARAAAPYAPPTAKLPRELRNLTYEQYKEIRYQPERTVWRAEKRSFELAFFHPGMHFDQPVAINEITRQGVRRFHYQPEDFDFGANRIDPQAVKGLGFAGFRVHYPVNTSKYKDEVLSFLGASYFRALGRGQVYGMSARGLAVDTAQPSGEEFPRFVEFWIERPAPAAKTLTLYALLDSPRVTGAYRFVLRPGPETAVEVSLRLFLRARMEKLGVAPLTSMFYFGANQHPAHDDYRPQVHDADGLSIAHGGGEWIWRPLVAPRRLLVTSFAADNPTGFGLQQRDRRFGSYEELAARYELRPSVWIEPRGHWGAGRVELVQIPTPDETNDNIVAYWVPTRPPAPGTSLNLEYRILWQKENERRPPLLWVMQTRRGHGYRPKPDNRLAYQIDFVGTSSAPPPLMPAAHQSEALPQASVSVDSNGELLESRLEPNHALGGWRLSLSLRRLAADKPVEMRARLLRNEQAISETWSYILPPD